MKVILDTNVLVSISENKHLLDKSGFSETPEIAVFTTGVAGTLAAIFKPPKT